MTTGKKLLFAIPLILQTILFITLEGLLIPLMERPHNIERMFRGQLPRGDAQLMVIIFGLLVVIDIVTRVFYILFAVRNKDLHESKRMTWILVLAFLGVIAQIFFYFKVIIKSGAAEKTADEQQKAKDFWNS